MPQKQPPASTARSSCLVMIAAREECADCVRFTAPCHFRIIAQWGACGNAPRVPHDAPLRGGRDRGASECKRARPERLDTPGSAPAEHRWAQARSSLRRDTGCDPDDPSTWTKPVVRLGFYLPAPFVAAANTIHDPEARLRHLSGRIWRLPGTARRHG